MSFPNYPDKYDGSPVLTARDMIAYRRQVKRFPNVSAPEGMIICLETSLPKKAERQHPSNKVGRTVGDILILKKTKGKVGVVVHLGFGAPVVAGLTEELIAWGVKTIVLISLCGGIAPELAEGQIVVCDRAIRDEGTSYHYVPAEKYAFPDTGLTAKLGAALDNKQIPYRSGTSWTIDATFRETREEVSAYQAEGVLTIEMETAAFFTVSRVHQTPAAAIYVVGDSLARQPWQPPSDFKRMDQSLVLAYSAAVEVLQSL
jgi:uridine phosphorylase